MLGTANVSGGAIADKIDLFGWSGNTGTAKWGIGTSTNNSYYLDDFVDWGKNIGDGTTYRTLTYDEWVYLLNTRTNNNNLKGVASIKLNDTEYANGLILLPDNWTAPADVPFKSGVANAYGAKYYATYQTFTLAQWQKLEAAGAVFLPASGQRSGSSVNGVQECGCYWSATPDYSNGAKDMYFYSDFVTNNSHTDRYYGQAVRLVQDIYAVMVTTPEHGSIVADKTEAAAGDEVTLTITPDAGYELDVLTVQDAAGNPVTVNDNKFTMPASNVTVSATFRQASPTAIGHTTGTADTTVRKILRNGQVLILRDGKTHTTMGIEVK